METVVASLGLIAVGCSVMVYRATRRRCWNNFSTVAKFFLTAWITGSSFLLFTCLLFGLFGPNADFAEILNSIGVTLAMFVIFGMMLKLVIECSFLTHLTDTHLTSLKRSALIMVGHFKNVLIARLGLGLVGGIVLLAPFFWSEATPGISDFTSNLIVACCALSLGMVVMGELMERYLFFTAEASDKMPGGFS